MQNSTHTQFINEQEIELKKLIQIILKYKYKLLLFIFLFTLSTLLYSLTKPNQYQSSVLVAPQGQSKPNALGGLSTIAGIAGINLAGNEVDIYTLLQNTFNDLNFNQIVIDKYSLSNKISIEETRNNMVFAFGYDTLYNILNPKKEIENTTQSKDTIYNTFRALKGIISISEDSKSGLITITAQSPDRFLAKELVDIYLKELTASIRKREMKEINKKMQYYKSELSNTTDIALKQQLSILITNLMQKSVLSKANEYYNVSIISDSRVAHIKEKVKPKRGLIVVVSFMTSIIIGIFGVFLIEFVKNKENEENNQA